MRRTIWIALFAIVTLVLAACSAGGDGGGGVVPIPDRADATVTADITSGTGNLAEESSIVGSITLPPGDERIYRVNVPSSDEPALYVYIDEELPLYVYDRNDVVATSRRAEWFGTGTSGLSSTAASGDLAAQDISVAQECPGACIVLDNPGSGSLYVRVRNTTSSTETVTLYAVLRNYTDANEDFDGFPGSPTLDPGDVETGAIESIGDIDYYRVGGSSGDFFLDFGGASETGIDLVAEITPAGGGDPLFVEANEGDDTGFSVLPGDEIRVYADNARAAVSGYSQYSVSVE